MVRFGGSCTVNAGSADEFLQHVPPQRHTWTGLDSFSSVPPRAERSWYPRIALTPEMFRLLFLRSRSDRVRSIFWGTQWKVSRSILLPADLHCTYFHMFLKQLVNVNISYSPHGYCRRCSYTNEIDSPLDRSPGPFVCIARRRTRSPPQLPDLRCRSLHAPHHPAPSTPSNHKKYHV